MTVFAVPGIGIEPIHHCWRQILSVLIYLISFILIYLSLTDLFDFQLFA